MLLFFAKGPQWTYMKSQSVSICILERQKFKQYRNLRSEEKWDLRKLVSTSQLSTCSFFNINYLAVYHYWSWVGISYSHVISLAKIHDIKYWYSWGSKGYQIYIQWIKYQIQSNNQNVQKDVENQSFFLNWRSHSNIIRCNCGRWVDVLH